MLTILTGTPGAGKTLKLISLLKGLRKEYPDRPIYVHNITGLNLEYLGAEIMPDPEKWYELPEGSILAFDEAQTVFPQRSARDRVPKKCQEFATHRHKGMDVFITTQDASNIDAFVRRMCGRHLYIHRILNRNTATIFEYDHYEPKPQGYHEKQAAVSVSPWVYPKKIFDVYKSASLHTVKKRTPAKLYLVVFTIIFTIGFSIWGFTNIKNKWVDGEYDYTSEESSPEGSQAVKSGGTVFGRGSAKPATFDDYLAMYKPLVPGVLETAPIYNDVTTIQTFPKPLCVLVRPFDAAYEGAGECKCYTQQITEYETTEQICRYWASKGYFDASKDEREWGRGGRDQASASRPPAEYSLQRLKEQEKRRTTATKAEQKLPHTNWSPPKQTLLKKELTGRR